MDYFAVMNSGSCSGEGSYQHEVIVGDEDPSFSFVGSPSWSHSFEELEVKDELNGFNDAVNIEISEPHNQGESDNGSCDSTEQTTAEDDLHTSADDLKDDPFVSNQSFKQNKKRKRSFEESEQSIVENNDYSRLLDGCRIIKKECTGPSKGMPFRTDDELTESSQSDEEQHSMDDGDIDPVNREIRR